MAAHLLLDDVYANAVGIFDITKRDMRPLHPVAMHDAEETGINSLLYDALKLYKDNRVLHHFGITWPEMKKMTHEEFTYIMQLSEEYTRMESKKTKADIDGLLDGKKPK